MSKQKKFKKGVSLIEVLVAIAIISILSSIGVGGFLTFRKGSEIGLNQQQVVNLMRSAQKKARTMKEDDDWGVNVSTNQVIIFKGNDFSSRDTSFDENTYLKGLNGVSGNNQIIFSKLTGLPDSTGTLSLNNDSGTKNIQINEEGVIGY